MTTIITTSSKNYATMIADQGITSDLMHPDMNKIVKQGTWLIGLCGEDRVCDVVQYATRFPKVPETLLNKTTDEWYPWVVTKVVPVIQQAVEENMHKSYHNSIGDSEAVIITHGRCFLIGDTLGVTKAEPYWAIGSGGALGMGALASNQYEPDWHNEHDEYAKRAIEVAQLHDPYTRGKITGYRSLPTGKILPL
jgi:ATP-dependent protease HslVU (ClpYQ) peptidase subunit